MRLSALSNHQRTGRPLGGQRFTDKLEQILARKLPPKRPAAPERRKISIASSEY